MNKLHSKHFTGDLLNNDLTWYCFWSTVLLWTAFILSTAIFYSHFKIFCHTAVAKHMPTAFKTRAQGTLLSCNTRWHKSWYANKCEWIVHIFQSKTNIKVKCICLGSIQIQLTASNCGQWRSSTSLFSVTWMGTRLQNYTLSSKIGVKSTRKAAWIVWQISSDIYVRKSK